jgi:hypothetical protein
MIAPGYVVTTLSPGRSSTLMVRYTPAHHSSAGGINIRREPLVFWETCADVNLRAVMSLRH